MAVRIITPEERYKLDFLVGDEVLKLAAATHSCVTTESSFDILEKWKNRLGKDETEEDRVNKKKTEKKILSILQNSAGKGHNQYLDLGNYNGLLSIGNSNRVAILASNGLIKFGGKLEQSTRRTIIAKFDLPDGIRREHTVYNTAVFEVNRMFDDYEFLLNNGVSNEDSMMVLGLGLILNETWGLSLRELYRIVLNMTGNWQRYDDKEIDTGIKPPELIRILGEKVFQKYQEKINSSPFEGCPRLLDLDEKIHKLLRDPLEHDPRGCEVYLRENEVLERIIAEYKAQVESESNNATILLPGQNRLTEIFAKVLESEDNTNGGKIKKDFDRRSKALFSAMQHRHHTYLVYTSIAAYIDLLRNRSVAYTLEPIYKAIDRLLYHVDMESEFLRSIEVPKTVRENKDKTVKDRYLSSIKRSILFYQKIINNSVSQGDAIVFIPHAFRLYALATGSDAALDLMYKNRGCSKARENYGTVVTKMAEQLQDDPLSDTFQVRGEAYGLCPEGNVAEGKRTCYKCVKKEK